MTGIIVALHLTKGVDCGLWPASCSGRLCGQVVIPVDHVMLSVCADQIDALRGKAMKCVHMILFGRPTRSFKCYPEGYD